MATTVELPRTRNTRQAIVALVVAFLVLLGAPTFLYTTRIHRAELPVAQIEERSINFSSEAQITVPVWLVMPATQDLFVDEVQLIVDEKVSEFGLGSSWQLQLHRVPESQVGVNDLRVIVEKHDSEGYFFDQKLVKLHVTLTSNVASLMADTLVDIVFYDELVALAKVHDGKPILDSVVSYSSKYNLVFSLLVENGRPIDWNIEDALALLEPVLASLSHYAHFKMSSQIQYYSKLLNTPVFEAEKNAFFLPQADLPTFINYGDWNLITHDVNPSINFLLYFPESNYANQPLLIEKSKTNSFLVPQWGGVHVYNHKMPILEDAKLSLTKEQLQPVILIFASQLFALLGVPKNHASTELRIESTHRIMAVRNLKKALETLTSLIKLSNSLNEISIPESTREHIAAALTHFDLATSALRDHDFGEALEQASKCVESSDKAFFEKEMVQQAYFPSEHKLAVYLPLLGPICTMVLMGFLKLVGDKRKEAKVRKEKNEKQE